MDAACWTALHGRNVSLTNGFAYFSRKKSRANRRFILRFDDNSE
jgi:hypothetical protein